MSNTSANQRTEEISGSVLSGNATKNDGLGFEVYASAIAAFLCAPTTHPPLTLSIEGEWGSGKSSFMLILQDAIRKQEIKQTSPEIGPADALPYRKSFIISFNAWRHDKQESLWSAFATELLNKLRAAQLDDSRFRGMTRYALGEYRMLTRRLKDIPRMLAFSGRCAIAALILIIFACSIRGLVGSNLGSLASAFLDPKAFSLSFLKLPAIFAFILTSMLLWHWATKNLGNPLLLVSQVLPKSPDYASRTSFVSEFQKDFENMIDSYVREDERLYVFIDDLDRCDMSRASELMQAIMLLINDGDRIVFVLGMDRDKVAAGIGLKYKDYVPLLSHLEDGTPSSPRELIRFGYEYLEKFIHLPFLVPVPRMVDISRFLGGLYSDNLKEKTGQTVQASKTVGPEVITSDGGLPKTTTYTLFTKINTSNVILTVKNDSEAVRSMVLMVAPLLSNNPRRLKQFLNLYRLTLFLADKTGLLGEERRFLSSPSLRLYVCVTPSLLAN